MIKWTKTKSALLTLERLLICKICNSLVNNPCSLVACDHYFCRHCVEKLVGVDSKCPECGSFAWLKDLKTNRQLANIVSLCKSIRNTVGSDVVTQTSRNKDTSTLVITPEQLNHGVRQKLEKSKDELYQLNKPGNSSLHEQDDNTGVAEDTSITTNNVGEMETGTSPDREVIKNKAMDHHDDYSTNSQESNFEATNSSIELFSTYSSSCCSERIMTPECEREVFVTELQKNNISRDIKQSLGNNTSMTRYDSGSSKLVNTEWRTRQNKGQKRKISDTEHDHERNDKPSANMLESNSISRMLQPAKTQNTKTKKVKEAKDKGLHNTVQDDVPLSIRRKSQTLQANSNNELSVSPSNKRSDPGVASPLMRLSPGQLVKRNKRGEGMLHVAAIKGKIEDVKCLLEQGANPNARDHAGWSPLHEACNHGHVAIAEMLLDNGALIDLLGGLGHDTPLHDAVANSRSEVVRLLVQRGAPLTARNKQGMTPLDYAVTQSMRDVLKDSAVCEKTQIIQKEIMPTNLYQQQQASKVILCTGLSTEQKEALEHCTRILGGKVVKEFSIDVTHLVTTTSTTGCCTRTMKYLCGLLCGKWIISFSWITKCLSDKLWVDEGPYEVKGTCTGKMGVPYCSRLNAFKQRPGLFDGCQFYFNGLFDPKTPHKEDLLQLVKYGGGQVLAREPKSETNSFLPSRDKKRLPLADLPVVAYHAKLDSVLYRCTRYVLYDPLSQIKPGNKYGQLAVVPVSWFLDCISNFEIMDIAE